MARDRRPAGRGHGLIRFRPYPPRTSVGHPVGRAPPLRSQRRPAAAVLARRRSSTSARPGWSHEPPASSEHHGLRSAKARIWSHRDHRPGEWATPMPQRAA
jgi:hypothetical protein